MDFLLPDDDTMELMRKEFANLKNSSNPKAFALSQTDCTYAADETVQYANNMGGICTALLFLYFVKSLGYNTKYGTQIFDSDRSLGRLQSVGSVFGKLNNLS